jgi:hypothetical protein
LPVLHLLRNPHLSFVRILRQRFPIETVLCFRASDFLPFKCQLPTLIAKILELEPQLFHNCENLVQTQLHEWSRAIQERTQIDPPATFLQQPLDRVEIRHQVARCIDEEMRHDDVVLPVLSLEHGREVALYEHDRWVWSHVRSRDFAEEIARRGVVRHAVDEWMDRERLILGSAFNVPVADVHVH